MKVYLIGIGTGNINQYTVESLKAVEESSVILGARRMLDSLPEDCKAVRVQEYRADFIRLELERRDPEIASVLFSGDSGFYSGCDQVLHSLQDLPNCMIQIIPGISSVQAFAAKIQKSWQNTALVSIHGRNQAVFSKILTSPSSFFLTDRTHSPAFVCRLLCQYECDYFPVWIASDLGYPGECILSGTAADFCTLDSPDLSVIWVENPLYSERQLYTGGIRDDCFIRDQVPMTKREVRSVLLSLMEPQEEDCCYYDIGAGTGSVSIELALLTHRLVYAVEHQETALQLLKQNRDQFQADTMRILASTAPDGMECLPVPDAVFIGGSDGKLAELVEFLVHKNSKIRLVLSAILPQTAVEAVSLLRQYGFQEVSMIQLAVTRGRETPRGDLMLAQNPIYLISGKGPDYE